ncbi:MAG: GTPase domain-containing protein [Chloroflexota bacterium]
MNDQAHRKIALAGAPMVGKTMLLYGLKRRNPQHQLTVDADETKRITSLDIALPQRHIQVMTASGAFVNDTVIPTVLTNATVVVYVISAFACINLQLPDFKEYVTCAAQVGTHWDDIPWLFVLNKVDLTDQNPLLEYIPPHFHDTIIRCVAVEDKGVDELWQWMLNAI